MLHSAAKMKERHDKDARVREWKVGELVGVLIPQLDRKRHSATNIPGIVVEEREHSVRVRYGSPGLIHH
jgi:hypothetical protein